MATVQPEPGFPKSLAQPQLPESGSFRKSEAGRRLHPR